MKPLKMTLPGPRSDCFRTAVASILECDVADDVPHFFHDDPGTIEGFRRFDEWLDGQGKAAFYWSIDGEATVAQVLETMSGWNPDHYYILIGSNGRGNNHAVVCCGGLQVHDPAWGGTGIAGPALTVSGEHGGYIFVVFTSKAMKRA